MRFYTRLVRIASQFKPSKASTVLHAARTYICLPDKICYKPGLHRKPQLQIPCVHVVINGSEAVRACGMPTLLARMI